MIFAVLTEIAYRVRWARFHSAELCTGVREWLGSDWTAGYRAAFLPPAIVPVPIATVFETPGPMRTIMQWLWLYSIGILGQGTVLWVHDRARHLTLELRNAQVCPPDVIASLRAMTTWASVSPN